MAAIRNEDETAHHTHAATASLLVAVMHPPPSVPTTHSTVHAPCPLAHVAPEVGLHGSAGLLLLPGVLP